MRSRLWVLAFVTFVSGCDKAPVDWSDPMPIVQPAGATRLVVDSAGGARFVPELVAPPSVPAAAGMCSATLRTARGVTKLFAGWWSVRRDSSAALYAAWSTDGGRTWGNPAPVDTSDVSSRGCNRPPPSITAVGDDVHVAYSVAASDGTGVFFAHFMGTMLHSPVAVIYGERLVPTAIAAEGDRVAVAYEEPNGTRPQIHIALSSTQGHIFESHTAATREDDAGTAPAVAMSGHTIAVSWRARAANDSTGSRVVRIGRIP